MGVLPFMYLGVPIFREMPKTVHLNTIADKVIHKFTRGKGHTLSLAVRCCFINSVITSSLVHTMMVYKWLSSLLKKIETTIPNYLWTGNITKKGLTISIGPDVVRRLIREGLAFARSVLPIHLLLTSLHGTFFVKDDPSETMHDRYFKDDSSTRNFCRALSLWPGLRRHASRLIEESLWLIGHH